MMGSRNSYSFPDGEGGPRSGGWGLAATPAHAKKAPSVGFAASSPKGGAIGMSACGS